MPLVHAHAAQVGLGLTTTRQRVPPKGQGSRVCASSVCSGEKVDVDNYCQLSIIVNVLVCIEFTASCLRIAQGSAPALQWYTAFGRQACSSPGHSRHSLRTNKFTTSRRRLQPRLACARRQPHYPIVIPKRATVKAAHRQARGPYHCLAATVRQLDGALLLKAEQAQHGATIRFTHDLL